MMQQQMMQQQMMQQQMMYNQQCYSPPTFNNNNNNIKVDKKRNKTGNWEIDLIMSQDAIDGFWDENEETKKLIDIISVDKFDKIKNKIMALNKRENEKNIIYTILVIYYLETNLLQKLNEYKLVLHKAYKFLKENGIDYYNIISDI